MGKSLRRLYEPAEGFIILNGEKIDAFEYEVYLALFSVVFQDVQLLSFTLSTNSLLE